MSIKNSVEITFQMGNKKQKNKNLVKVKNVISLLVSKKELLSLSERA